MNRSDDRCPTADKTALSQQDSSPESFLARGLRSLRPFRMERIVDSGALFIIGGLIATTVVWVRWGGELNDVLKEIETWIKS